MFARTRRIAGESPSALARAVAEQQLTRIHRGVYVESDVWTAADERARHLLRMRSIDALDDGPTVFSHHSAALVWGLPLIGQLPSPHLSFPVGRAITRRSGAICHTRLGTDVVEREGFTVTPMQQTVTDLVSSVPLTHGLPALDFALSDASPERLDAALIKEWVASHRPFRGVRRLDAALGIATGLSQSPLESLSLVRFAEGGISRPSQQVEIATESGSYWVDFYWPDSDVVGEADGRGKYQRPEDLWKEKRREDAIRARVRGFVRWSWADIWRPSTVPERLRRAGV